MFFEEYKDYYSILGVQKTAQKNEIKQKFRRLALKYHPDRFLQGNKEAEAKFKEITEAYNVLSDEEKRSKYDRLGQYWEYNTNAADKKNTKKTSTTVDTESSDFSQYGNFEEFIDELLGRFSTTTTNNRDRSYSSSINNKNTSYSEVRSQNRDSGKRSVSISSVEPIVNLTYAEAFKGTVKQIDLGVDIVQVRIPPGVKSGTRIRLPRRKSIIGRSSEDLYLNVKLDSHSFFSFEDDKLICEVPIAPDEAVLGSEIAIPTPDGMVNVKVPSGINSGQILRLQGKGWSSPNGARGDLLVRINIAIPQNISVWEERYYQKIRELRSENPRENLQQVSLFS